MGQSANKPEQRYRLLRLKGELIKWGRSELSTGDRVTYAFARHAGIEGERNCRPLDPIDRFLEATRLSLKNVRRMTLRAMQRWSAAADITFVETEEASADIVIGTASGSDGIAFTDVSHESDPDGGAVGSLTRALICLDATEQWTTESDGDPLTRDLLYVMTHELGHAIGIDHPGRLGALMGFAYDENAQQLAPGDIAAATALYGPPVVRLRTGR